ncbi:MAG: TolB family protein, partial [Thermoanaerobaculia bacterium]
MRRTIVAVLITACALSSRAADIRMLGEGVISTSADEFAGAITPDGRTIYFDRSIPRSVLYVICVSHLVNGRWTAPEVAPFSGQYRDSDPVLSPDGKRLYFASDRIWPGQKEPNFDI